MKHFSNIIALRHKNVKLFFYAVNVLKYLLPGSLYRLLYKFCYSKYSLSNEVEERINYYNKITSKFELKNEFILLKNYKFRGGHSSYFFDLFQIIKYFNQQNRIAYKFGDITSIPDRPTIVKSRPVRGNNKNSVILKLNKVRHFTLLNDTNEYQKKLNKVIWRGHIDERTTKRIDLFNKHFNNPLCDLACTPHSRCINEWKKEKMTMEDQLKYKFIFSIEGIDVATNLKWIMSSNSIAVMPEPEYETWFMEGRLIPDFHYIQVQKDFSDVDEKIQYYINNEDKALSIIKNAHEWINQFKNRRREKLISLMVLDKYFDLQK